MAERRSTTCSRSSTRAARKPLNPADDPIVAGLTTQLDNERKVAASDYKAWQCQLYGGCGSPQGNGVLAQASETRYNSDERQITSLTSQIAAREQDLQATDVDSQQSRLQQAQATLPTAQAQLKAAQAEENSLLGNFQSTNSSTNGLLIRLKALDQLSAGDSTLQLTRFLLFLLFLVIEILPVTVKLLQQPGNYEEILRTVTRRELKRAQWELRGGPGGAPLDEDSLRPTAADAGLGGLGAAAKPGRRPRDPLDEDLDSDVRAADQGPPDAGVDQLGRDSRVQHPNGRPHRTEPAERPAARDAPTPARTTTATTGGRAASSASTVTTTCDRQRPAACRVADAAERALPVGLQARRAAAWAASGWPRTSSSSVRWRSRSSSRTPGRTDLPERRARALQEARAMARVRHQAIVPIHDVFFIDDDPWIVMEYISGRSLHDIIKQQTLDERSIARIGLHVLRGLVAVHRAKRRAPRRQADQHPGGRRRLDLPGGLRDRPDRGRRVADRPVHRGDAGLPRPRAVPGRRTRSGPRPTSGRSASPSTTPSRATTRSGATASAAGKPP